MGASSYLAGKSERDLKKSKDENHDGGETPLGDGLATFAAFILVGFVPVIIYVLDAALNLSVDATTLFAISCFMTGATFMAIGIVKGQTTKTNQLRSAVETLALGSIAAVLAYVLGDVLAQALGTK